MYLDTIQQQWDAAGLPAAMPCSAIEVAAIERELMVPLPGAFREFLFWLGAYPYGGEVLAGFEYHAGSLPAVRQIAQEILVDNQWPTPLSPDLFVFTEHDGYNFFCLPTRHSADPPVHFYEAGMESFCLGFESRFSDWLQGGVTATIWLRRVPEKKLNWIGKQPDELLAALRTAPFVERRAAAAILATGVDATRLVHWEAAFADTDVTVRRIMAEAIYYQHSLAFAFHTQPPELQEQTMMVLKQVLGDPDETVRRTVAASMAAVPQWDAESRLGVLTNPQQDPWVRRAAGHLLAEHQDSRALPPLLDLLALGPGRLRRQTADSLTHFGPDAGPTLVTTLADPNAAIVWGATQALSRIAGRNPSHWMFELLRTAMAHSNSYVRGSVAYALKRFAEGVVYSTQPSANPVPALEFVMRELKSLLHETDIRTQHWLAVAIDVLRRSVAD